MGICRNLCRSVYFVNMRLVVEVIFSPIKFYTKIYLQKFPWMGNSFLQKKNFSFV